MQCNQLSKKWLPKNILGPNFFHPKLTYTKLFQTELTHISSFCGKGNSWGTVLSLAIFLFKFLSALTFHKMGATKPNSCAENSLQVDICCHRVLHKEGGFKWGVGRPNQHKAHTHVHCLSAEKSVICQLTDCSSKTQPCCGETWERIVSCIINAHLSKFRQEGLGLKETCKWWHGATNTTGSASFFHLWKK